MGGNLANPRGDVRGIGQQRVSALQPFLFDELAERLPGLLKQPMD